MLYSLLITCVILAISCPIIAIFAFIKGYNLKAEKVAEKPIKVLPEHKEEPKGDPKLMTLLANIDAYDGTGKGQKVIDG